MGLTIATGTVLAIITWACEIFLATKARRMMVRKREKEISFFIML
jgi:hypothetical protein